MSEDKTLCISRHAKERYAERILGKDTNNEIKTFIAQNEDKIQEDIEKMIKYGELIYSGKQKRDGNRTSIIKVYLQQHWIILIDTQNDTVITLYKIDLGCGEDFNDEYIKRMLDKLHERNNELENIKMTVLNDRLMYEQMINENTEQINEYKSYIKNLEELNSGYKLIINNNMVKSEQAGRDVADIVNELIGKKEF